MHSKLFLNYIFIFVLASHALALFYTVASDDLSLLGNNHYSLNTSPIVKIKFKKEQRKTEQSNKLSQKKSKNIKTIQEQVESFETKSTEVTDIGDSSELSLYTSKIQNILNKNKYYPPMAKRLGHKGIIIVEFTLESNGKVKEILKTEGRYPTLKRAVQDLITSRSHFPPFPKDIHQDELKFLVPINFEL